MSVVCWLLSFLRSQIVAMSPSCLSDFSNPSFMGSATPNVSVGIQNEDLVCQLDSPMCEGVEGLTPVTCSC